MESMLDKWIQSLKYLNFGWYEIPLLSEIKKAYRDLSLKWHPDKCHDCDPQWIEWINDSYEFLKANYTVAGELHQATVDIYRGSMEKVIGDFLPFADMQVTGNEEVLGRVIADFGVDVSELG